MNTTLDEALDLQLILDVQRRVHAANVHRVNIWLFCYKTSQINTPRRRIYEKILRDFAYGLKFDERRDAAIV
jgi:hypothetical protein